MKSQVTLLLICMLFSKALSLTCQQCLAAISGTCKEITCPDQCLTSTASVVVMGLKVSTAIIRDCGTPKDCVNSSVNLGNLRFFTNTKCCKTDLCNNETLPAVLLKLPNELYCHTCNDHGCSDLEACVGDEDRCISATVQRGGMTLSAKGCATKSVCSATGTSNLEMGIKNLQCCEGNLCNSAESFMLSFLLMIVPLLSSILFC